jgi:hypothetical protein
MSKRVYSWGIGTAAVLLSVMLYALNLQHGNLNQDEGWYLYAARSVASGKLPYRDFAFTQGPVLPVVYGAVYPVVNLFGVGGGRLITALFGFGAALLAAFAAGHEAKKERWAVALVAFLLIGGNVYQSYFTTITKTYGLCAFLLMTGCVALTYRQRWWGCLGAGLFFALAAGTRLSAGIVLPVAGLWLLWQHRDLKNGWLWFGVGGGLMLLILFGPFLVMAPESLHFGLLGYHSGRDPGGFGQRAVLKIGFISRFVQAYFLFVVLTLGRLLIWGRQRDRGAWSGLAPLLWICGISLSLLHFSAPFPYDDYQVIAFPMLGMALALSLRDWLRNEWAVPALSFLLLASVAGSFSSPINQHWFVIGQDRIWWRFKEKSDLQQLREAADFVRENSPAGSTLLTQDTYLAVQADRNVPAGMEMGPFCYYPDMCRQQAERLNLLNRDMLFKTLKESDAPIAALSGYGLRIESPAIAEVSDRDYAAMKQILTRRFEPVETFDPFGQAHTILEIYLQNEN